MQLNDIYAAVRACPGVTIEAEDYRPSFIIVSRDGREIATAVRHPAGSDEYHLVTEDADLLAAIFSEEPPEEPLLPVTADTIAASIAEARRYSENGMSTSTVLTLLTSDIGRALQQESPDFPYQRFMFLAA